MGKKFRYYENSKDTKACNIDDYENSGKRKTRDFSRPVDQSSKKTKSKGSEGNAIASMDATSSHGSKGSYYQTELPLTKSRSCDDLATTITRRFRTYHSMEPLRKGIESEAPVLDSQQETSIKNFDVIIIGAETSAVEYFNTLTKEDWQRLTKKELPRVAVIGQRESWLHMRPDWQMGQVAHLLSLSGHNVPEYSAEFMTAGNYAAKLENARTGMSIFPHIVSSIEKSQENKKYRIKTQDTIFSADKIIIATGSGPARQRENIKVSQETAEIETPYKKVISGSEYVKEGAVLAPLGSKIAIEGPSATAAWAYQKALLAGYSSGDIYWFTRNSNFDTAFPSGGRNRDIQETSKGNRYTGKLLTKGIIVGDKVHLFFEDDPEVHIIDQYIVAIGADIKGLSGAWSILSEETKDKLEAIYDTNKYFSDDEERTIIGLASEDKSLLVVGVATYKMLKEKNQVDSVEIELTSTKTRERTHILQGEHLKYVQANKTLPTNACPPEGIPTVIATIEALNNYMPLGVMKGERINYNLANRTQLAAYIAQEYPNLPPSIANKFVEDIVKLRTNPLKPFGMDQDAIKNIEQEMDQEAIRNIEQRMKKENSKMRPEKWEDLSMDKIYRGTLQENIEKMEKEEYQTLENTEKYKSQLLENIRKSKKQELKNGRKRINRVLKSVIGIIEDIKNIEDIEDNIEKTRKEVFQVLKKLEKKIF